MSNNEKLGPSNKKFTQGKKSGASQGKVQRPVSATTKRRRTADQVSPNPTSTKPSNYNLTVEDFIQDINKDEGGHIYDEFKQILRHFEITSMKELRKRLEGEGGSDGNKQKSPKESNSNPSKTAAHDSREKRKKDELQRINETQPHYQREESQRGSNSDVSKAPISSKKDKKTEGRGKPEDVIDGPIEGNRIKELERNLQEKEKELEELRRSLTIAQKEKEVAKAESDRNQAELEELKRSLTIAQKEKEVAKAESDRNQAEIDELKRSLAIARKEKEVAKAESDQIQADYKNDKASDSQLKENKHMKESEEEASESRLIFEKEKEIEKLKTELQQAKKDAEKNLNPDTKKLKDEIDQLKNRLSQLAGSKLTEGNPAIADLSDMNRPINLGEKFSELYDNQWTDAFEELCEEGINEDKAISELVKTVTEAYNYCVTQSEDFHRKLKDLMKQFGMNPEKLPTEVSKQIKDHRKSLSISMVQDIQERFCKEQNKIKDGRVRTYARQCIAVCWFMSVQDPPVYMDTTLPKHKAFDTEKFKAYTKTGKKIHFLVWPALYLHEGGPLLCKGVAQGK